MEPLEEILFPEARPIEMSIYQPLDIESNLAGSSSTSFTPATPVMPLATLPGSLDTPSAKPYRYEESWTLNLPSPVSAPPYSAKNLSGRPYSELDLRRERIPGRNTNHMKVLRRIHLGADSRCNACGCLYDFEGKCTNPDCDMCGTVVNQEKYDEFQNEVERNNADTRKEWEEEIRRISESD